MSVRAKFRCNKTTKTCWGDNNPDSNSVTLSAVGDSINKSWAKWTPGGTIEMTINNPDALDQFKVGEYYFVDFTVAPAKESDEIDPRQLPLPVKPAE